MKHWFGACIAVLSLWASAAHAQVAIKNQPDPAQWYAEANGLIQGARIPAATLPTMKPGTVDATLAADLLQYDWLDVGSYNYADKAVDAYYDATTPCQIHLERHQEDGGDLSFDYGAPCATVTAGQIRHYNFTPPHVFTTVVVIGGVTYLQTDAWGEKTVNRVLSYTNGVLVLDLSRDGKPASKQIGIREVRVRMPQRFSWAYGE